MACHSPARSVTAVSFRWIHSIPVAAPSAAEVFAPRVAPDEAWVVTATPGDRISDGSGTAPAIESPPKPGLSYVTESDENLVEPRPLAKSDESTDRNHRSGRVIGAVPFLRRIRPIDVIACEALAASFTNAIKRRGLRNAAPSTTEAIESDHSRWADVPHPRP